MSPGAKGVTLWESNAGNPYAETIYVHSGPVRQGLGGRTADACGGTG